MVMFWAASKGGKPEVVALADMHNFSSIKTVTFKDACIADHYGGLNGNRQFRDNCQLAYARIPHNWFPAHVLRLQSNSGSLLVPPLGGEERAAELGPLLPHSILLEGNSWKESSVDIAIAGAASC